MAYRELRSRRTFGDLLSARIVVVFFLSLWHQTPNHPGQMTEGMTFEIRQRFFSVRAAALLLEKKDGQRAEQRKIARAPRFADLAAILVLGAIPAVMLAVLNRPMVAQ